MTCTRQLNALMRKNFIYNKRHYIVSLIEFFFPILLVTILAIIRNYLDIQKHDNKDFEKEIINLSETILDLTSKAEDWYGIRIFNQ
jgi:hypothetical protein